MNKFLLALLLSVASLTATAGPASIAFEYNHENVQDTGNDVNEFSIIPGYVLTNGIKLDAKFTGRQSDGNTTAVAFEPRAKYMFAMNETFSLGGRVSLGETLSQARNYSFYTVEPIAEWTINKDWAAQVSLKYRGVNGSVITPDGLNDADSTTVYVGGGYRVTDLQSVSAKVYSRNAYDNVADSSGLEVNYAIRF